MFKLNFLLLLIPICNSCIQTESSKSSGEVINTVEAAPKANKSNQVISLQGSLLPVKQLTAQTRKQRQNQLEEARKNYESNPVDIENIIWYGRRLAYLGRYQEAIRIFSIGIDLDAEAYRVFRHRGHRYITTRKFDEAIVDLQQAAFYARIPENKIEPDGLPNRINQPLTNDKFNIWYHLGIAYYLKGNYDKAISSFKHCLEFADNDDLLVANVDWFYMTYRKIGNISAAEELLTLIPDRTRIIENFGYRDRLRLYAGKVDAEDLLDQAKGPDGSLEPTLAYGVANWYLYNGQVAEAELVIDKILRHYAWDAFGYIAAEADKVALSNL